MFARPETDVVRGALRVERLVSDLVASILESGGLLSRLFQGSSVHYDLLHRCDKLLSPQQMRRPPSNTGKADNRRSRFAVRQTVSGLN
jgi:hypothetical protein